jgi:hypothetical protein
MHGPTSIFLANLTPLSLQWSSGYDDTVEAAGNLLVVIGGTRAAADSNRTIRLRGMATAVYDDSQLSDSGSVATPPGPGNAFPGSEGRPGAPGRLVCSNCSSFVVESAWRAGEVHVFWLVGAPPQLKSDDDGAPRRWPAPGSASHGRVCH